MGLNQEQLRSSMNALAAIEPGFGAVLARVGYPEPRIRPRGYETLLRTIVGQQVSVKAAAAVWNKLDALLGEGCAPDQILASDFDALRGCGLSRQKQGYARSLAELVLSGALDLHSLPEEDEDAIV
ncbi:MAG: DNA-3-methyladenine glycosylase 2 family protein, partial [Alphaproteobacteria bacterium]|nr:DNA-3-methyladenine glycosylase 2 family protein [Alphaproteobacteria bacterium]